MNNWLSTAQFTALNAYDIHVWLFHVNTTPPSIKRFYPLLDEHEKERSERFVHFMHRKRFIAAHGFMRSVLALYTQQPADTLVFDKGEHGKPFLVTHSNLHFNLSHSQDIAMLAVANQDIGIDVECINRKNDWQSIMQRFFTASEQNKMLALDAAIQQRAFFEVWTRKEAHMKVTGQGLHLAPGQFTVSVPPEPAKLLAQNNNVDVSPWQMFDIELTPAARDYCACVSLHGEAAVVHKFLFS
jgi:4'-phosphopantetheinyl transferase